VEEIKRYGDRAVVPLQEHFSSGNAFEYEMAMRLMGELGGKRIIEPFKKVILSDQSARKREYALRWITQGPWDQASKVISQAAEKDPDQRSQSRAGVTQRSRTLALYIFEWLCATRAQPMRRSVGRLRI